MPPPQRSDTRKVSQPKSACRVAGPPAKGAAGRWAGRQPDQQRAGPSSFRSRSSLPLSLLVCIGVRAFPNARREPHRPPAARFDRCPPPAKPSSIPRAAKATASVAVASICGLSPGVGSMRGPAGLGVMARAPLIVSLIAALGATNQRRGSQGLHVASMTSGAGAGLASLARSALTTRRAPHALLTSGPSPPPLPPPLPPQAR